MTFISDRAKAPFFSRCILPLMMAAAAPFAYSQQIATTGYDALFFGDMDGVRERWAAHGVTLSVLETSDYVRNVSGGVALNGAYIGMTSVTATADLNKLLNLKDMLFNISALQIHGHGLSQSSLMAFQGVSSTEADSSTRLFEVWLQRTFLNGSVDVRLGKQSIDQEFLISTTAVPFMNLTFGWAALPSADLPGGAPVTPLAAMGARLRIKPDARWTLLTGVFSAKPARRSNIDPQVDNNHGLDMGLHGGVLAMAEAQYTPRDGSMFKLGGWAFNQSLSDQQYDANGALLALPVDQQQRGAHRLNYGGYGVVDQVLWQSAAHPAQVLGSFARIMGAPSGRNLIDLAVDGGVTLKAPFQNRSSDLAGLAVSYSRIGNGRLGLYPGDNPAQANTRTGETAVELTYVAQLRPWWQVQGDIQKIFRPGGGVADPTRPDQRVANAVAVALRTTLAF